MKLVKNDMTEFAYMVDNARKNINYNSKISHHGTIRRGEIRDLPGVPSRKHQCSFLIKNS